MNPVLFKANSTNFNTNGVGRLTPISCTVTEERNSVFELDMTVKIGCNHFDEIKQSAIVTAKPSPGRRPQAFRISKISRAIGGKVKIKAEHISYQLNYIPVRVFSAQGVKNALNGFKANALENCPFTFNTDIASESSYSIAVPESVRHYLGGVRGSILDVYGGEYEWDNYNVILHKERGKSRGVTLRYGKNITNLQQEENIQNTYTGIVPYWENEGTVITLPEGAIHSENAANFPFQRTVVKDFSDKFNDIPTVAQLRTYAQNYIRANNIGIPTVSIDVSFVDLAQTQEYKDLMGLQTIELCDTITVAFPELGVDATAKVTKTVYDVLEEKYKSIGVGDVRSSLAKTIEEQIDAVELLPTMDDTKRSIDRATGILNAGRKGHFIIGRNAQGWADSAMFLSDENVANAQYILLINQGGIGFSSDYGEHFYQAWTLDGVMSLGGVGNHHGQLHILDSNGNIIGKWTNDGIYANGGELKIGANFYVDKNGNLRANNGTFIGGSINIGQKFRVDSNGNLYATDGQFTGKIESGSTITGAKIVGSEIGTKNGDDFYAIDNGEETEVGFPGFDVWDKVIHTSWIGQIENPATGGGRGGGTAGINGRNGDAGFRRLFLLDGWYEGEDGSMWDVTRTIRWIDNRLRSIENFCAHHDWSGDDDDDDPGSGYDNGDDMEGNGSVSGSDANYGGG